MSHEEAQRQVLAFLQSGKSAEEAPTEAVAHVNSCGTCTAAVQQANYSAATPVGELLNQARSRRFN